VSVFLSSFCFVFLKSAQQLNVQHDRKLWVLPTSFLMAFVEVSIVLSVVREQSLWTAIPLGAGAGLGCLSAMFLHRRIRNAQQSV
jgi:hypothetical protein